MNKVKIPKEVKLALHKINRLNNKKVHAYFHQTIDPLSTGFVISAKEDSCNHDAIFYSLLSFDFYFFSNVNSEIYTYLENEGYSQHVNNFFDKDIVKNIKKYLVTL